MNDESRTNAARSRAARLLGYRAMSKGELRRKLILKGVLEEDAEDAVKYLADLGYLDDEVYAQQVVEYYAAKGYNEWRIKQELRRHLVPSDFWPDIILPVNDSY